MSEKTVSNWDKRKLREMYSPVTLSIRGIGTIGYIELHELPKEIRDHLENKCAQLEAAIRHKQDVLERLSIAMNRNR